MRGHEGRSGLALAVGLAALFALAAGVLFLRPQQAAAHNAIASGTYDCNGGWSYSASYVNGGGGGGSADNRLVIVDVNIGANVIKVYHYFDTLTSHPAPPAGFTVVDHPTLASFPLVALTGTTSPITVSGSVKLYSAGTASSPSSDPAYKRYEPSNSVNPIPVLGQLACPSSTATATSTATPTSTSTPTVTPTFTATATLTPSGPVFADLSLSVDKTETGAGLSTVPIGDIPVSVVSSGQAASSTKLSGVSLKGSALSSVALSSVALSSVALSSVALSSVALSSVPISTPGGWQAILGGTALDGVPLQEVTLGQLLALNPAPSALSSVTLGQLDLGASSLQSLNVVSVALSSVALSSVPVPSGASDWCQALASAGFDCSKIGKNSSTIGNATLLELAAAGAPIEKLGLDSTALSSVNVAGSALSSVALSSVALSSVDLSAIHLGDLPPQSMNVAGSALSSVALSSVPVPDGSATWCDSFAASGHTCQSLGIDNNSTLFQVTTALQSAVVPLQSTALSSVALSSVALSSVSPGSLALSSVALSSVAINGTALSSVALSSVNIQSSFLAGIALSSVPLDSASGSLLRGIALSSVSGVIDCTMVNCPNGTLGQAADAGAILPGAKLGDIAGALAAFKLGDIRFYGTGTVQDVLNMVGAAPGALTYFLSFLYGDGTIGDVSHNLGGTTLGQILVALLAHSDYPWEDVSLAALSQADLPGADNAAALNYTARFTYTGGSSATQVSIAVTLPDGFHYIKGSSTLAVAPGAPAPIADPAANATTLTWTVAAFPAGAQAALSFQARPGLQLGPGNVSGLVVSDAGHPAAGISGQAPVAVVENFEPNDGPSQAQDIGPDKLVISHIGSPGDSDFFRLPANLPVGSRIDILLSHQAHDNDVALFRPAASTLRPPSGAALSSVPLADAADSIGATTQPHAQVLQDINLPKGLALSSVSANRGTTGDSVSATSLGDSGFFTVEVSGYLKSSGNEPYVLREKVVPPPIAPQCPARVFPFAGQGVAGSGAGVASNVNTLFLVNQKRLGDLYGAAKAAEVVAALNALALRSDLGVTGAVISVDTDSAVNAAYDAWDANPCSPTAANAVVRAINSMVDGYRGGLTGLQNIVIAGSDDVIPFARVADLTHVSNESDYTSDILAVNGQAGLLGSFITSNVLSDNTYGAFHPITWLDHQLSIPEVGVGRLVETPDQITGQVSRYIAANGRLDPTTALTTGYDFLADGSRAVADALDGIVGAGNDQRLINGTWTSSDLVSHFNQATPVPGIASINAHYDHHRLLPGAGNTANDQSDLFTTQNILRGPISPQVLPARLLFSMGCHSGLNVPDAFGSASPDQAPLLLDWPQAYADQGAAVYVGNTGYGYGDTDIVAYSEALMAKFAQRIGRASTIGQALAAAKQDYYGSLAQYESYDEKVLSESVFYGLPMYHIGAGTQAPAAPLPLPTSTDPVSGLTEVQFDLTPNFEKHDRGSEGAYYTINGESDSSSGRPIEPRTSVDLPAVAGKTAHGLIVTGMSSTDETGFHAVFSKPSVDGAVVAPPSLDAFPSTLHNLASFIGDGGPQQRAIFMPAQFIPDPSAAPGIGTQRNFGSLEVHALYSSSTDVTAPTILQAHATNVGGVVSFFVEATDDVPDNVVRAFVLYKPPSSDTWTRVELVHAPGTDRWTSSAPVTGDVSYVAYAVDAAGNVGVSSNKALLHHVESAGLPAGLTIGVTGTDAGSGWLGDASVAVHGASGVTFEVSINGAPFQAYSGPFALSGDGLHLVTARGSDLSSGTKSVAVDAGGPLVNISSPLEGATFKRNQPVPASYLCTDAGSGVQSCAGGVTDGANIDTSTAGPHMFTVSAADIVGHPGSATKSYTVLSCAFDDGDCDGMPDSYEAAHSCENVNIADDANDADGDGLANGAEFQLGTNPCIADTDSDLLSDGAEVNTYHTDPMVSDSDNDGCRDGYELRLTPPASPLNPWDFYSVPVPALFIVANPVGRVRDGAVGASDAQAVFRYFKAGAAIGIQVYEQDLNLNGVKDGIEYDRSSAGVGVSGPPDGVVSAADAQIAFRQFARNYQC